MNVEMNSTRKRPRPWFVGRTGLLLSVFFAVAAFFLVAEHRAHFFGYLPLILLALCIGVLVFLYLYDLSEERKAAARVLEHLDPDKRRLP